MDLFLCGIQGSGKGTQAKVLSEKYNFKIFEAGDELRKLAKQDSELGKKIKNVIEEGHLVSNEIIMEIVENFITHTPTDQQILFDGIPRKLVQKETFDALIEKLGRKIMGLQIIMPEEKTINRLIKRAQEQGRADDTIDVIRNRLAHFYEETVPVLEEYQEEGRLLQVNGDQSIEKVSEDIFKILDPYFIKQPASNTFMRMA
ncbi:MAG: adenylate kinase family protein [Candidatus Altimarinota bacterium]